uniref:Outer dynein armdocking complex subunit 3 putative n=1 Tax=Albugo laibachii Nc14 TaxID=890382 RepID=F0WZZ0_9STRA|nr:outer dynein armdocking complex subunit 3 putative [Albugo laibachii Nc14]|eukprot:CCA27071.1 outer dynein armdocking complex subunit 3 putative [Albugo laibachii Nc14]
MNANDGVKGMVAQEEKELRRVFEYVASYRAKKKLQNNVINLSERRQLLRQQCDDPDFTNVMCNDKEPRTKEQLQIEIVQLDDLIQNCNLELAALQSSNAKCIRHEDLYDVMKSLGKTCTKKEVSDMIWEADENLDGVIDWTEMCGIFNRILLDKTELEPVNFFNVIQFLTYDKKNSGIINADDTMAILFARYGSAQLEFRMKEMFGEHTELSLVQFLEHTSQKRRANAEVRVRKKLE